MPKVLPIPKKQITLRIDEDILERLETYSVSSRTPKSLLMQTAINEYLDRVKAPWPHEQETA